MGLRGLRGPGGSGGAVTVPGDSWALGPGRGDPRAFGFAPVLHSVLHCAHRTPARRRASAGLAMTCGEREVVPLPGLAGSLGLSKGCCRGHFPLSPTGQP